MYERCEKKKQLDPRNAGKRADASKERMEGQRSMYERHIRREKRKAVRKYVREQHGSEVVVLDCDIAAGYCTRCPMVFMNWEYAAWVGDKGKLKVAKWKCPQAEWEAPGKTPEPTVLRQKARKEEVAREMFREYRERNRENERAHALK